MRRSSLRNRENHLAEKARRERLKKEQEEAIAARREEARQEQLRVQEYNTRTEEYFFAYVKRMVFMDMSDEKDWVKTKEEHDDELAIPKDEFKIFVEEKAYVEKLFNEGGCTEDEMFMEVARLSENYAKARREHVEGLMSFWMRFCWCHRRGVYENWRQELCAEALKKVAEEFELDVRVHGSGVAMVMEHLPVWYYAPITFD